MVNLMVRVIMGVGVITASFIAGQHSVAGQSSLSGMSLATTANNHSTAGMPSTDTEMAGANTATAPEHTLTISLNKQVRLVDAAARTAVGGGTVVSVTPINWQQTAAWDVLVQQASSQYDVIVAKTDHSVLAKKTV